jgi:hypothetical protein
MSIHVYLRHLIWLNCLTYGAYLFLLFNPMIAKASNMVVHKKTTSERNKIADAIITQAIIKTGFEFMIGY